jgi:ABC-type uncharacterized transport system substrate-binding protein
MVKETMNFAQVVVKFFYGHPIIWNDPQQQGRETMKKAFISLFIVMAVLTVVLLNNSCRKPVERKSFTVGVLNPNPGTWDICRGFMEGLKESSEAKGNNINFIESKCESPCDIDAALKTLLEKNPDMIFTVTTPATKKTKKITKGKNIPVIFAMYDPVGSGVITSLPRPGGNYTGIQIRGSVPKALEWLLTLAPEIKHIFVPIKFDTKAAKQSLAELRDTAEYFGIRLTVKELDTQEELDEALASIPEDVDAIFLLNSILISANAKKIADEAIKRKLPSGAASSSRIDNGVLISFGINRSRIGKQAARLAHMILQGESAGDIPSEIADFYLGLNLQTATKTGIAIMDEIIVQADDVIR